MRRPRSIVVVLAALALAGPAAAAQGAPGATAACDGRYHVSPDGDDAADGGAASPFRTIQRAADVAAAGDTVCVAPGLYRERVHVRRSGRAGAPIVFQGAPGAVVDGGDPHRDGWTQAAEIGERVWKKRIVFPDGSTPYHGTLDGKYILRLRDTDAAGKPFMADCGARPRTCTGGDRLRSGPRGANDAAGRGPQLQGWDRPGVVSALFGVADGWTYLALADGGPPNGRELTFASRNSGAFTIDASFVTVRGFTIRGANYPVYLPTANAHHVTIEDSTIRNGFFGVFLAGGAHHNVVRRNDVSIDYAYPLDPADRWHWFIWNAFRNNSELHRASISMSGGGAGNEIASNTIHDAFGGIDEDGSTPPGAGVRVHGNVIERCANDALTINGGPDSEWFDNRIVRANVGTRFWPSGRGGSVRYYRNRIEQPDPDRVEACLFFFRGSANDELRVYDNTCTGRVGILFGSTNVAPGLPKLELENNTFDVRQMAALNDFEGWKANFASAARRPRVANNRVSAIVPGWLQATTATSGAVAGAR